MICATCGRDNPARLTFCQDCGARLAARVTAPTPPVGIPKIDTNPPGKRPSAPDFTFTRKEPSTEPGTGPSSRPGGAPSSKPNGPPSGSPRPAAPVLRTPEPSPEAVRVSPEVALPPPPSARSRTCPRCKGTCDAGVAFCRFCGASLDAAAPAEAKAATAPAGAAFARILSIGQDGKPSASFDLVAQLDFGRSEGDVVIGWDPYLSPRHLRLSVKNGAAYALDLGSVNGTFVRLRPSPNSATSEAVALQDQDLILLGQQVIRFEVVKDAEAGFGPATQHGTAVFGTPAGPVYARLCQRTVEGVTRDVFHVRKDEVVLGRELGDVVFTDDAFLSRRHAVLRRDGAQGTYSVVDAGSSNGTFIRVRGEVRLEGGDEFRIGQQLFRIELPPASPRGAS